MSKKESSYENLYTQQIFEAVSNQSGYESKKQAEKEQIRKEHDNTKRNLRVFGYFLVAGFLGVCGYLINLDPDNAGPCAIALGVFMLVSGFVYFWNR